MASRAQEQVVFHLTGRRAGTELEPVSGLGLRPALFARVEDLERLRYDFPLVLAAGDAPDAFVRTLSGCIDELLQEVAPRGMAGERMRRNVLRLEREIRALLGEGASGSLSSLWPQAAERLVARGGEAAQADLARARNALAVDGELADCDRRLPARLAAHAWSAAQLGKAHATRRAIEALIIRLSDLVKADFMRSESGRRAELLKSGVGGAHQSLFDFDAMARLLAKPSGKSALPGNRRRRIEAALAALRAQRFFADAGGHAYRFDDVQAAIAAFRERLPEMAQLVRAMAIAELELSGRYDEAQHDAYFAGFGAAALGPQDLAMFPDYLVCQRARAGIMEALPGGLPLKILVVSDDVDESPLAGAAMALGEVYVLQAASSHLYRMRGSLLAAMRYPGTALISVYSGASAAAGGLPCYLGAAAATESHAFPAFTYDPSAGTDWAQRFSLAGNPQPETEWPEHEFCYADENLQRVRERLRFGFADFVVCDPRYAGHFARLPRADWDSVPESVPWIYAVDDDNRLHKLIYDERLAHGARRCAEAWHRLQELDGLRRKAQPAPLAEQRAEPDKEQERERQEIQEPAAEERKSDDPYIETPRCSSCNECTNINGTMFAYDGNKQAYIADPDAGTYAQLVEAAESCQLSIIHPGKPRNAKEPGLDELLKRAEPFL